MCIGIGPDVMYLLCTNIQACMIISLYPLDVLAYQSQAVRRDLFGQKKDRGVRRKNKGGCTAIKQYLLSLNRQNLLLQQIQLLHKVLFIQLKSQILYASTEVYIIFVFKKQIMITKLRFDYTTRLDTRPALLLVYLN